MNKEKLFFKLYDALLDAGLLEENNFDSSNSAKEEFLKISNMVFEDYHILDMLHELK